MECTQKGGELSEGSEVNRSGEPLVEVFNINVDVLLMYYANVKVGKKNKFLRMLLRGGNRPFCETNGKEQRTYSTTANGIIFLNKYRNLRTQQN
jgi:predicted transcriptional regulator